MVTTAVAITFACVQGRKVQVKKSCGRTIHMLSGSEMGGATLHIYMAYDMSIRVCDWYRTNPSIENMIYIRFINHMYIYQKYT